VYLETPSARKYPFKPRQLTDRNAFDPSLLRSYLGDCPRRAGQGGVYFGRTTEDLGYILIPSFRPSNLGRDFAEALRELGDTRGLILDLRNNRGGKGDRANEVASWFLTSPMEKPPVYHEGRLLRFLPLRPKPTPYTKPVVVLVNGASFSEAERFAEIMKQVPTVRLVGETTGGGSAGGGNRFVLPNGRVFSFGTYDYRRYDGSPWEGQGIEPDLLVFQTPAHVAAGRDRQLEVALRLLG
jgi:C-terminal processing protease CtpA/Prc